jgi:hypothetical protein
LKVQIDEFDEIPQQSSEGILTALRRECTSLERGLRILPKTFWVIQVIMVLLFGTVTPFNMIHGAFLKEKWYPNDPKYAAQVMGVPDTLSALLVPFAGTPHITILMKIAN